MQRAMIILAAVVLCCAIAAPAAADDTGWHLRLFAAGFDPSLDETVPAENPEFVQVSSDTDLGYGASLEYQFSSRWGVEFGFMQGDPAVKISGEIPDDGELVLSDPMTTTAVIFDVDFHITPHSEVFDFYVGAGIARLSFHDLFYEIPEVDESFGIRVNNDTALTVKAGLGIALGGSSWSAIGGLRYTDTELVVSNSEDSPSDTVSFDYGLFNFTVGISYSF